MVSFPNVPSAFRYCSVLAILVKGMLITSAMLVVTTSLTWPDDRIKIRKYTLSYFSAMGPVRSNSVLAATWTYKLCWQKGIGISAIR